MSRSLVRICLRNYKEKLPKVQPCKLYNNKYMINSTQTRNLEKFFFMAVLVLKLLRRKVFFLNRKGNRNCLLTGKLLQNYKYLECKKFKILLKHVSDNSSVLFQLVYTYYTILYYTFNNKL